MNQLNGPLFCSVYGQTNYCHYSDEFRVDFGEMKIQFCHERLRQLACKVNQLISTNKQAYQVAFSHQFELCPPGCDGEVFAFFFDELIDLQTLLNGSLVMTDLYQFLTNNQLHVDNS